MKTNDSSSLRWLLIFVLLCGLTIASFSIANSGLMTRDRNIGIALIVGISAMKAMLVVLFFMHLWWEHAWKYVLTIPALVMAVVLTISLVPDVMNRSEYFSASRDRLIKSTPDTSSSGSPTAESKAGSHE